MMDKIEKIDVSDLPDEEINILRKLAALFRERTRQIGKKEANKKDEPRFLKPRNLGVIKGTLSREEIYDYL